MKILRSLIFYFCLNSLCFQYGVAQDSVEFNPVLNEISDFIPPLEQLIDSAIAHNPFIRFRDLQLIVNRSKIKTSSREWTRSLGIQSDVRYGTFDNFSTNLTSGQNPVTFGTTRTEVKWGYAAYLNIPLYNFINRRNQINMARAELDQAESMARVQRDELRQIVIQQYNDLILQQRLLRIKSKQLETSRINMMMTEKEFATGVIPVSEYARISEIATRAETDYEISRMDFLTSYMILEEIVKMKFNLAQSIKGKDENN